MRYEFNLIKLNDLRCDIYIKCIVSKKLVAKLDKYKFMRYLKETIEYYLYHPVEKKVFVSKHVTFLKKKIVP
jgi:hypothetical protein